MIRGSYSYLNSNRSGNYYEIENGCPHKNGVVIGSLACYGCNRNDGDKNIGGIRCVACIKQACNEEVL